MLVHGYRSDALDKLGLDAKRRRELRPGLIDVALNAYGWSGPWRTRRGFDSLVQMSTGIAATLVSEKGSPVGMAADADRAYWYNGQDFGVKSATP